jgi:hypothetical protein
MLDSGAVCLSDRAKPSVSATTMMLFPPPPAHSHLASSRLVRKRDDLGGIDVNGSPYGAHCASQYDDDHGGLQSE